MLSKKFLRALKNSKTPYYRIACEAGISPIALYRIMIGIIRPGDWRVRAVAHVLGLKAHELFEKND